MLQMHALPTSLRILVLPSASVTFFDALLAPVPTRQAPEDRSRAGCRWRIRAYQEQL
jgi:hypothetical protein